MKTYRDILEKLQSLTTDQLDSNIIILNDCNINDNKIELILNTNSLYQFRDVDLETYYDFEDDETAKEYKCEKILKPNYPIIKIN